MICLLQEHQVFLESRWTKTVGKWIFFWLASYSLHSWSNAPHQRRDKLAPDQSWRTNCLHHHLHQSAASFMQKHCLDDYRKQHLAPAEQIIIWKLSLFLRIVLMQIFMLISKQSRGNLRSIWKFEKRNSLNWMKSTLLHIWIINLNNYYVICIKYIN